MYLLKIKDIPNNERPRERLLKYGVDSLSNEELLSIILKNGTKKYSVKTIAMILLNELGEMSNLKNISYNKLIKIDGIGSVKAVEIIACVEIGKRIYNYVDKSDVLLNNSNVIFNYFKDLFLDKKQEYFYAIYLDSKSKLISYKMLFKGTLNSSCVHPREVFKHAYLESANSIIVIHNHPSGDPNPSKQDNEITKYLMEIGNIMALPVVDHIIFGHDRYFSFYEYMHK